MAAALERVESFITTAECASALKPKPPYCFGMIIPRKPLSLTNCQTCGGRSWRSCVISQSSLIAQRGVIAVFRLAAGDELHRVGRGERIGEGAEHEVHPPHELFARHLR